MGEIKQPPTPKGIYRVETEGYQYFGRVKNLSFSQLFLYNEKSEEFYIFQLRFIDSMLPVVDYPKYNKELVK